MVNIVSAVMAIAAMWQQSADQIGEAMTRDGLTVQSVRTTMKGRLVKADMDEKQMADLVAGLEKNFAGEAQRDGKVVHTDARNVAVAPFSLGQKGKALLFVVSVGSVKRLAMLMGANSNKLVRVVCSSDGIVNARFSGTVCGEQAAKEFDGKLLFGAND